MKSKEEKAKFIEMRANGLSYDNISKELNVSKPTLLKWSRELEKEIANAEYLEMQSLFEKMKLSSEIRIETLSGKLKEVYEELKNRDVTTISIKDLLLLKDYIQNELSREKEKYEYHTGETVVENFLDFDLHKEKEIKMKLE